MSLSKEAFSCIQKSVQEEQIQKEEEIQIYLLPNSIVHLGQDFFHPCL